MTREQRLVFGEDPELYDRARPGYSDALVSSVLEYMDAVAPVPPAGVPVGASEGWRALEVGAGTGKATVAFASRGIAVLAVEPDPGMAAVAARNTTRYPGVRIHHGAFEDWPDTGEPPFDLVFSGQAWHWVRPEVRTVKAAAVLRPGGTLALFWHRPRWPDGDPVRDALDACYAEHAPALRERGPSFPGTSPRPDPPESEELERSGLFTDIDVRHHPWESERDADGFLALLATQSDHRLLPADERDRLLGAVRELVQGLGGTIRLPYDTLLVLARPAR